MELATVIVSIALGLVLIAIAIVFFISRIPNS